MAVRPWLGAIKVTPTDFKPLKNNEKPPKATL